MEESPQEPTSRHWKERFQKLGTAFRRAIPFASGVLASLAALLLYNQIFPAPAPLTEKQVNDTVVSVMASATPPPSLSSRVYQAIIPSIVLIEAERSGADDELERSLGSGVVITDQGDILTSLHVVEGANNLRIIFADGSESSGEVVVEQVDNDIAVLHAFTPPAQIIPAVLGNPNAMNVGDEAFVVGNPFGLYGSMSTGVISGFERSFESPNHDQRLEGLIQFDTAVNPGNSGGPLLNRDGHVVGIVVGILNPTDQDFFIGIGFAVPITIAAGAAGSPPY